MTLFGLDSKVYINCFGLCCLHYVAEVSPSWLIIGERRCCP